MGFMRSGLGYGQGPLFIFVLVATVSMLTVSSMAKTIVVGGSEGWHSGFDYTKWAFFNLGVIHVGDVLVFKYAPPYNVYLLKDSISFQNCILVGATKVGKETAGSGEGFKFVIEKVQNYYFTSGANNNCNEGKMKFAVPSTAFSLDTHG